MVRRACGEPIALVIHGPCVVTELSEVIHGGIARAAWYEEIEAATARKRRAMHQKKHGFSDRLAADPTLAIKIELHRSFADPMLLSLNSRPLSRGGQGGQAASERSSCCDRGGLDQIPPAQRAAIRLCV